ncbi:MAG: hypothetical protein LUB56_00590 [Coprobacillus sp.]|nr:hypothetical protein [Coprobacillus sp.]
MLTSVAVALTLLTVMPLTILEFPGGDGDGSSTYNPYKNISIYSSIIGPYEGQGGDDMTWTVVNPNKSGSESLTVYADLTETVTVGNTTHNGRAGIDHREDKITIKVGGEYTWDFYFDYFNEGTKLYGNTITVDFNLYESATGTTPAYQKTETYTIYDVETREIASSFSPIQRYYQYYSNTAYMVKNESYAFSSSYGYLFLNGNTLDIDFDFTYNPGGLPVDTFTCEEAYILVNDYGNVYPYMSKNEGDSSFRIELDTSYNQSTNEVSLSIKDGLYYVNPNSLQMYDTSTYGTSSKYQKTKDFYMPVGKADKAKENTYRLVLNGCGYNKVNLYKDLDYYPEKDYFSSNCNTSNYCVIGKKG